MKTADTIRSILYMIIGLTLIIMFAGKLIVQLIFMIMGLYLINEGLKLRGFSSTSMVMRMFMSGRLR